ncbi:hypothetical protein [Actinomadura rupiterrae]|uniref:hypothetical protein n=1 Tax=Actinomadura rupiterrae TaxID=559627 RepID=UPI0020A4A592|nr:hypothetical protein [Actinomadura rupiterrae]MCP2343640.1 hypothetical protein [Actinomadura rupiterrae]
MRPETRARLIEVKNKLADEPDLAVVHRLHQGATDIPSDLPAPVKELLAETDGFHVGWISVPPVKRQQKVQFYLDQPEMAAATGRENENWYVVAVLNDFPLLMDRADGSIWWFSEPGLESYFDSPFEKLTDSLDDFIEEYALGSGYRRILGADGDEWYEFLVRHGFASAET